MQNKSSTFLRGIKPRRKIILSHSSPQQGCGVFWKVLDKYQMPKFKFQMKSKCPIKESFVMDLTFAGLQQARNFEIRFLDSIENNTKYLLPPCGLRLVRASGSERGGLRWGE
jgi:hypothetical protein